MLDKDNAKAIIAEIPRYSIKPAKEEILKRNRCERDVDSNRNEQVTRTGDLPHTNS